MYPTRVAAFGRRVVFLDKKALHVSEDGGKTFTRHEPAALAEREYSLVECGRAGCNFFKSTNYNDYPLAWRWGDQPAKP